MTIVAKSSAPGPFTPPNAGGGGNGGGEGPAAPTNVGVWAGETSASVYWRDASGGDATGFKVYRSTTQGFTPGAGNLVHTTGVALEDVYDGRAGYVDTGLTNGTTYYYRVKATDGSADSSATSEVSVTPTAGGAVDTSIGGGTNEPGSTTRVLEWDMGHAFPPWLQAQATGCDEVEGLVGSAKQDSSNDEQQEHVLVYDNTAPRGGPLCHEIRYPAHKEGESSHEKLWMWETPSADPCDMVNNAEDEYEEVYIRDTRKIWTDRADGKVEHFGTGATFKLGHLKGHLTQVNGTKGPSFTLNVAIDTQLTEQAEFPLTARMAWTDLTGTRQSDVYGQNQGSDKKIVVGTWHEIEWYAKMNTIAGDGTANADGILRAWIDGELVMEHTNVKMRCDVETNCQEYFQNYDHTTTWSGGPGNTHEHNKGMLCSHTYVSGIKGAAA